MPLTAKTQDIEIFLTVVDAGSFSNAAKLMDQPVAKISRAITRLEQALDVPLFNRTTRRISLTHEGQTYVDYARQGLNTLAKGEEAIGLLNQCPKGDLRVDAASPFVLHQLTPLVNEFCQAYPGIHLDISSHDDVIDLLEHKADVAIRIGDLADSNLHARLLGRSQLHIVASPEYLQTQPINSLEQLSKARIIGFSDAPHLNNWPLRQAVHLPFAITASSGETVRQLCIAGQGVALLSNLMVAKDIQAGRLHCVLSDAISSPNRRESVQAVYYRNSAVSSRICAFLDFIAPRLQL